MKSILFFMLNYINFIQIVDSFEMMKLVKFRDMWINFQNYILVWIKFLPRQWYWVQIVDKRG